MVNVYGNVVGHLLILWLIFTEMSIMLLFLGGYSKCIKEAILYCAEKTDTKKLLLVELVAICRTTSSYLLNPGFC
jgi:hypothetical protein